MSKWLCIGCGKVVEDDCIQNGCMACRRRAADEFYKKIMESVECEIEQNANNANQSLRA